MKPMSSIQNIPAHVAIIMDGNGRWAKLRGLPRLEGHRAGVDNIRRVVEVFAEYGIRYLTLFAFSTENWERPRDEVRGLTRMAQQRFDEAMKVLHENNIRVRHIGRLNRLSPVLQRKIRKATELTKNNTRMTLCVAFDYGGRAEIVDAARRLLLDGASPQELDEATLRKYLYAPDIPDPDLLIRTGGEMRISNFLLWQSAYTELYFTEVLWPDFDRAEIEKALRVYSQRQRRFGRV